MSENPRGILLTPIPPLEDLAGVDANRMTLDEMKRRLDKMRSGDPVLKGKPQQLTPGSS